MKPRSRPILVFDGDCAFCCYWVERLRRVTGDHVEYAASRDAAKRFPEVQPEEFDRAVQFFDLQGRRSAGAEAMFRALSCAARRWAKLPWLVYLKAPGIRPVADFLYHQVARHRRLFSFVTRLFWGANTDKPGYGLTRWVFLRGLGAIYLIAFVSLWTQIAGLVGRHGILPAQNLMNAVRAQWGWKGFFEMPTLCWLGASDGFLHILCAAGLLLSLLLIAGWAPVACLGGLWLIYLSLSTVGQVFMGFQWDALLLEAGLLSVFLAPRQWAPGLEREAPPSRVIVWLFRWLLFRLVWMSGAVKLASGDPVWRNLSAMDFHFETQPLPTVIAWYIHHWPSWMHTGACAFMFFLELAVPLMIFGPRRLRGLAFVLLLLFQVLILMSGNYGFFNLLTMLLCLWILDDTFLRPGWRNRLREAVVRFETAMSGDRRQSISRRWPRWAVGALAATVLFISPAQMLDALGVRVRWPPPLPAVRAMAAPWRSINGYGLFAIMTTSRPEIDVQGSRDGVHWESYGFKYKPGPLERAPVWVQPHQPRLDWQLWFAALGGPRQNTWFLVFCGRLLQGAPDALALVQTNPFGDRPPRYIRAVVYDYHFTDPGERAANRLWWKRQIRGLYCPVMTLRGDEMIYVP